MGCHCTTSKEINIGECNFEEEQNNSSNTVALKNKRNSTKSDLKEIEIMQNKFIEEIKQKEDYEILNSINIKEYLTYECLQAFDIFSNEYHKFREIIENYPENLENKTKLHNDNDEPDDKDMEDKDIENSIIFKMPPIKYLKNDSVYEGEFFFDQKNNQFNYAGDGILITSNKEFIQIKGQPKNCEYIKNGRIFYPNGDIFVGTITKEEPYSRIKGIFFENVNGKYDSHIKCDNFNENTPYIIKHFNNGDIYEGESIIKENKFVFKGNGKLTKKDKNTIYKGNFSGNLYNGKGELFKPLGGLSEKNNIEENIGKTIISNWVNGKPNGDGLIREKYSNNENFKNTTCSFRFGKLIKYTTCLVKGKKKLNENIFDFLNIWEISSFVNHFKTKSLFNYLKKNNNLNLIKIKIYRACHKYDIGHYKKEIFNNEIFTLNINNYNDIINHILENKCNFLPFVCYRSDGGEIEQRYRAFNIFNPEMNKIYSTNYLSHKDTNITINSIFNRNMYEEYKKNEEQIYDIQEDYIYNLMNSASLYKSLYNKFESNYPVRNIDTDIIEYNNYILSNDIIGNIKNILCTIQYITIFIPDKNGELTVLINPCYFLAVYIGDYNNKITIENENEINTSTKKFIDINDNGIKENNYDLKLIKENYNKYIINEENNINYEYIEFDTNIQKEYEYKILCLVKIKEKNKSCEPYPINLKKFYHIGNMVNVKLINQLNIFNRNERGYSIDFGTIHFYGDVIYLNE